MAEFARRYAPGWTHDAIAMMTSRTASSRAAFFLPLLRPGMRVLDVGCGPGTITVGLARAVAPGGSCTGLDVQPSQIELARVAAERDGVENASFTVGSAHALPFPDGSFDAVFSHALFEHLPCPAQVAVELRRVLRTGGIAGVCCSDWGHACIEPLTEDVTLALECHLELRRRAGGDPYAGSGIEEVMASAAFDILQTSVRHEVDMSYLDFASYIGTRVAAAAREAESGDREWLLAGAAAAERWASGPDGRITLPWTAVLARFGREP